MAKFDVSGFEDIEKELLNETERAKELIPKMLNAAADIIVEAQKAEIENMFGSSDRSTGDLKNSIKKTAVKQTASTSYIEVAPTGKDRNGVKNAEKGFVLNYGRSNMPAKPWMDAANKKADQKAFDAMREIWMEGAR